MVIPAFARHLDVELLLGDLSRVRRPGVELWVVVVDNASPKPLTELVQRPGNLAVEIVRSPMNGGGAGGFRIGLERVLRGDGVSGQFPPADFVWLLDSDVRVEAGALMPLVKALRRSNKYCAVGSSLVDTRTGMVYERGAKISKRTGLWKPIWLGNADLRVPIPCRYLAACSMLVRREAIERAGIMPDVFIHGDDVLWSLQLQQATGQRVAAVPRSRVHHPWYLYKFQTWIRYFGARNCFAPMTVLGLSGLARFRRAMLELQRAVGHALMGVDELAHATLCGLEDAHAGKIEGWYAEELRQQVSVAIKMRPLAQVREAIDEIRTRTTPHATVWFHPLLLAHPQDFGMLRRHARELGQRLKIPKRWKHRSQGSSLALDVLGGFWRMFRGPAYDIAVVPTGWPTSWFRGRSLIQITPDGFFVRSISRGARLRAAARTLLRGTRIAFALGRKAPPVPPATPAPARLFPGRIAQDLIEPKPILVESASQSS